MKKIINLVVDFFVQMFFFPVFWKVNQKIVKSGNELAKLKAMRLAWNTGVKDEWENSAEIKKLLEAGNISREEIDQIEKLINAVSISEKKVFLEDDLLEMRANIRKTRKKISELEKEKLNLMKREEEQEIKDLISIYKEAIINEEKDYTQKQKLFDKLYISEIDIAAKEAELEKHEDQKKAKNKLIIIWSLWFLGTAIISALIASLGLFIPFHPKKITLALFCLFFLAGNILALKKNFCEVPYM